MALFRTPVVALMPDITPLHFRSQANGIINFMGGLGALLVFFAGKPLYDSNITFYIAILFLIGGFGWALINVNSLPMVVDMTTLKKVGGYTGLYYFFSQAANIIAPPLSGISIDLFGYPSLMVFASFFFILFFITMHFVRRGEIVK